MQCYGIAIEDRCTAPGGEGVMRLSSNGESVNLFTSSLTDKLLNSWR